MLELGVEIRNHVALKIYDHIFQEQFPFLESSYAKLVDHGVVLQAINKVVEISMTDAQLSQTIELPKRFSVDLVGHLTMLLAVRQ